jgi:uncharacterized membrane protein
MKRIYSIDLTRGIVMIIMALDHVRDLMHVDSATQSPTNLATTTPLLFFTRWITHLCAPTFVFLAGSSAYLSFKSKNDIPSSRRFLLKRGLWLVLLEFVIVNFALFFDPGFHTLIFEVIATIGFGFVILSLLLKLSVRTITIIGLTIIFFHNLLTLIPFGQASMTSRPILASLYEMAVFPLSSGRILVIGYPPIPWLGIMLVGFASGKLFELPQDKRRKIFLNIGGVALLLFVLLRFVNIYGDPSPWSSQRTAVYTFLSFMNVTKYPPSLLYCLVMLGIMFLILGFAEQEKNRIADLVLAYGKAPLFYFIIHLYLIHCLLIILLFLQGFHWADLSFASGGFGRPKGMTNGIPLWAVYLVWIGVVAVLYKPTAWFGRYKAAHKYWWLSYM